MNVDVNIVGTHNRTDFEHAAELFLVLRVVRFGIPEEAADRIILLAREEVTPSRVRVPELTVSCVSVSSHHKYALAVRKGLPNHQKRFELSIFALLYALKIVAKQNAMVIAHSYP